MPYQGLNDGLYLMSQASNKNGIPIDHYGILDIGNVLQYKNSDGSHPVVIHQTPPNIQADWLANTGQWDIEGQVTDVSGAMTRIQSALNNPEYDLFGNNCEHFARFVAYGKRHSKQIFWVGTGIVAAGALALYLFKCSR